MLMYDTCELCGTKDELTPIEIGVCGTVFMACRECCHNRGLLTNQEHRRRAKT